MTPAEAIEWMKVASSGVLIAVVAYAMIMMVHAMFKD